MSRSGFIAPELVPLCGRLADAFDVFASELAALTQDDFIPWFDYDVYSGEWFVYPIVARLDPLPLGFDLVRARRQCPRSSALLAQEPQVLLAGFSRLMPGTFIRPHTDRPGVDVLRFHLGFGPQPCAELEFPGERRVTGRRHHLLIDHSMTHSSQNQGALPRDVLLVDIRLGPAEAAAVRAVRGDVHLGRTAYRPDEDARQST